MIQLQNNSTYVRIFNTRRGVVKNHENYLCSKCLGKIIIIKGGE